jgi:hypothetical protein
MVSSPHCVSSPGHTDAKRLIKTTKPLVQRILLLLHIGTLLKLLLFSPLSTSHGAEESTRCCANRRAFSSISSDRSTDRAHRGSASASPKQTALRGTSLRRRSAGNLRIRWIKASLLNRPVIALPLIVLLLLRTLALAWVDIYLTGAIARIPTTTASTITSSLIEASASKTSSTEASTKQATPG